MICLSELCFQQGLSTSLWIYASEWHPKAIQWEPQVLGNLLSTSQNWNHQRVPRQECDTVKYGSHPYRARTLHYQKFYVAFGIEISLGLILWVLW